jgi:hypothetical protein
MWARKLNGGIWARMIFIKVDDVKTSQTWLSALFVGLPNLFSSGLPFRVTFQRSSFESTSRILFGRSRMVHPTLIIYHIIPSQPLPLLRRGSLIIPQHGHFPQILII